MRPKDDEGVCRLCKARMNQIPRPTSNSTERKDSRQAPSSERLPSLTLFFLDTALPFFLATFSPLLLGLSRSPSVSEKPLPPEALTGAASRCAFELVEGACERGVLGEEL